MAETDATEDTAAAPAPLDGVVDETNQEGQVLSRFTWKQGVLHGEAAMWRPDGGLSQKMMYENGALNGELRVYGETGDLEQIIAYRNNVREGDSFSLVDGVVISRIPYSAGVAEGVAEFFDPTGKIGRASCRERVCTTV